MSADHILLARTRLAGTSTMSLSGSEASSTRSTHAQRLAYPKSNIQLHLKNHYRSKTYTSGSPISGELIITTRRDVRFETIEILLLGISRTRTAGMDGYSAPHESAHTFLKIAMPIPESSYPVPRVIEAGRTMTVPFNFVIPNFLTLSACDHNVSSDLIRDQHLCLPPSMGSWTNRNWEKDDLAPRMAAVEYSIKARVWHQPELHGPPLRVMETIQQIQVLPAFPEEAPLSITKSDTLYRMSKSKTMRKNLITAKLGKLTVSARQPNAIMLQPDGKVAANTIAQVELRFDPVSIDVAPPKVTSISGKITAHTYYSASPLHDLPNMGESNKGYTADRRTSYSTSVNLFSETLDTITWVQHRSSTARRDSGYSSDVHTASDDDEPEEQQPQPQRRRSSILRLNPAKQRKTSPSTTRSCPLYHTSTIAVPINLPTAKKTFIPSFYGCINSRVYTLHLALTVAAGSTTTSTTSLTVPVQIAVEAGESPAMGADGLPSFETALEEAAADEFLRPRVLSVPEVQFRETSELPGYGP